MLRDLLLPLLFLSVPALSMLAQPLAASEAAIRAVGVLGNTGEQGPALVRQTGDPGERGHGSAVGCGLVLDREGTLWTRLDDGAVSRLSLDGRQLARFTAPPSASGYDTLALLGDQVLLLAAGELHAVATGAASGSAFKSRGVKLRALAHTAVRDRLAAITADGGVVWVGADGVSAEIAHLPDAWIIEADGAGNLHIGTSAAGGPGLMHRFVLAKGPAVGELTTGGWPKPWMVVHPGVAATPGFLQWDDGGFFAGGPGSVSRFDADLEPQPGTVLGMQGNYVIGRGADWRVELATARGIARIRPGLYAVGGQWGQPFFAEWPDPTRSMHLVSWFTASPICRALNLDADGTVFVDRLVYGWTATPDSFPLASDGGSAVASAIVRAGPRLLLRQDRWAHGGDQWALPLYSGDRLQNHDWIGSDKLDQGWWNRARQGEERHRTFAAAAYPDGDGLILLCLAGPDGGRAVKLNRDGRFTADAGPVAFHTTVPGQELTALALRDQRTLLAAIDGQVVELAPAADGWQEQRRWNSWGGAADEHFGPRITLDCDHGRLLVADGTRQRVLWFAAAGGRPKACFGTTDTAGDGLQALSAPGLVAICGDRAVVHDAGNQRLVKLELSE